MERVHRIHSNRAELRLAVCPEDSPRDLQRRPEGLLEGVGREGNERVVAESIHARLDQDEYPKCYHEAEEK